MAFTDDLTDEEFDALSDVVAQQEDAISEAIKDEKINGNPASGFGPIVLNSIPVGPGTVTARKIYRSNASGGVMKLIATIENTTEHTEYAPPSPETVAAWKAEQAATMERLKREAREQHIAAAQPEPAIDRAQRVIDLE